MTNDQIASAIENMARLIASQDDFQAAQMDDYIHASVGEVKKKMHDLLEKYEGKVSPASFVYFIATQVVIAAGLGIALAERELPPDIATAEIPEDVRQRAASLSVSCGMICAMMLKQGITRSNIMN